MAAELEDIIKFEVLKTDITTFYEIFSVTYFFSVVNKTCTAPHSDSKLFCLH